MATLMETERKMAVKPPLRYLPEDERNALLKVSTLAFFFFVFFLHWMTISRVLHRAWRPIGRNCTKNFCYYPWSPTRCRKWKEKQCWKSNWTTWRKTLTCWRETPLYMYVKTDIVTSAFVKTFWFQQPIYTYHNGFAYIFIDII